MNEERVNERDWIVFHSEWSEIDHTHCYIYKYIVPYSFIMMSSFPKRPDRFKCNNYNPLSPFKKFSFQSENYSFEVWKTECVWEKERESKSEWMRKAIFHFPPLFTTFLDQKFPASSVFLLLNKLESREPVKLNYALHHSWMYLKMWEHSFLISFSPVLFVEWTRMNWMNQKLR